MDGSIIHKGQEAFYIGPRTRQMTPGEQVLTAEESGPYDESVTVTTKDGRLVSVPKKFLEMDTRTDRNQIPCVRGWYGTGRYLWTVFCKLPDSPRGTYVEEFDVRTVNKSMAAAKDVVRKVLAQEGYDTNIYPSRVEKRNSGMWF